MRVQAVRRHHGATRSGKACFVAEIRVTGLLTGASSKPTIRDPMRSAPPRVAHLSWCTGDRLRKECYDLADKLSISAHYIKLLESRRRQALDKLNEKDPQ